MKSKLNLIAAIFALLTLHSLAVAQRSEVLQKQGRIVAQPGPVRVAAAQDAEIIEQQITARIEASQQNSARVQMVPVEAIRCVLGLQQTISGGVFDNLALPTEATFKSPALLSVFPIQPRTKVLMIFAVNK